MKLLNKEKLEHNIEKIATYDFENHKVFGSSYFVWQNGDLAYKKHFGNVGLEDSEKVNDKTIYRLASMTKPITAVAILILIDRGLVSLNDPVSKYLPEFADIHIITPDGVDLGKTKTEVTILHCLTHTSGFGSGKVVEMTDKDRETIYETIKCFYNAGLTFEPFTSHAYSAFAAFDVLATIIEKVTGQDYAEFLKNEIFIPCNMPDTTFSPSQDQWKRIIEMHNRVDDKNCIGETFPECVFESFPCGHNLAGAGLVSTLDDYANFAKMLLNKGTIFGKQIVSPETMSKMPSLYLPKEFTIEKDSSTWGLGVRVVINKDYKDLPIGSFGWSGAYGSHFWIDPENDICAVFMKNSRIDGGSFNQSARHFEKAVADALTE